MSMHVDARAVLQAGSAHPVRGPHAFAREAPKLRTRLLPPPQTRVAYVHASRCKALSCSKLPNAGSSSQQVKVPAPAEVNVPAPAFSEVEAWPARSLAACALAAVLTLATSALPSPSYASISAGRAVDDSAAVRSLLDRSFLPSPSSSSSSASSSASASAKRSKYMPSTLGGAEDEEEPLPEPSEAQGQERYRLEALEAEALEVLEGPKGPRFYRNLLEWALLGAAALAVQRARRPDPAAVKLGVWGEDSVQALAGTRWRLTLDVGREQGTWMPPGWAASGRRIEIPVAVHFREGGVVEPLAIGKWVDMSLGEGTWRVDGDTLRFNLRIEGFERGDLSLPEGLLYFKNYTWGNMMSQTKGKLLLKQRRAVVRQEWRTVGTFKAEQLEDAGESDDAIADSIERTMPAARLKQGDIVEKVDYY